MSARDSSFSHSCAERNLVVAATFLAATGARFVVVGGCALVLHGVDHHPADLDLVPETSAGNLRLLFGGLDALGTVGARHRPSAHRLSTTHIVTRTTPIGSVDVLLERGRDEYSALEGRAADVAVDAHALRVAALDDVMRLRARFGKDGVDA